MKFVYTHFILLFFSTIPISLFGQQKDYIQMLQGTWKFQVGDSIIWSESDYNDSQWDMVNVPSAWEDQGFYGLDGFAWYRKEINLPKDIKSKDLFISLGYINDVDQVYLNGNLLGFSGSISPKFVTALDVERKYPIPQEYWNLQGRNVISVRVYNHHMSGGIITGTIGIYEENFFKPDISLIGLWRFRAGDNIAWKDKGHNDKNWRMMVVPGNWKCHGYKDYEGIGWYRTVFSIPDEIKNQKLVFVAGKIENCDEVYINGIQIGNTGKIRPLKRKMSPFDSSNSSENIVTDDCSKPRMYAIPDDLLNQDGENIISIRVYNKNFKGGITDGPIGIIRQTSLNRHIKDKQLQLFND